MLYMCSQRLKPEKIKGADLKICSILAFTQTEIQFLSVFSQLKFTSFSFTSSTF